MKTLPVWMATAIIGLSVSCNEQRNPIAPPPIPSPPAVVKDTIAVIDTPKQGTTLPTSPPVRSGVAIDMVYVEGGTFTMGCTAEQGKDCDADESPTRSIAVSSFYIGKYEITRQQWRAVMGNDPSHFKQEENCPVEQVSWEDIQLFIQTLHQQTGKHYRLPTEAEWEFAARGGNSSKQYKYAGHQDVKAVAIYEGNSHYSTQPVGRKVPNELGIYDMSGNVWEWCSDLYRPYGDDSAAPTTETRKVLRGGSWGFNDRYCRLSHRLSDAPTVRSNIYGFRLVADK